MEIVNRIRKQENGNRKMDKEKRTLESGHRETYTGKMVQKNINRKTDTEKWTQGNTWKQIQENRNRKLENIIDYFYWVIIFYRNNRYNLGCI